MTHTVLGLRFSVENGQAMLEAAEKGRAAVNALKVDAVKANEEMKRSAVAGRDAFVAQTDAAKKTAEAQLKAGDTYVASLRRQADTLGMTRTQVLAYDAAQRELNQTQGHSAAQSILEINAYEQKNAALGRLTAGAVKMGLALGLAGATFLTFTGKSIAATAALDDLHETTALSVEMLSSLQQSARIGGHNFDLVRGTASRFAQSVADAAGGNEKLLRSFDALGISQDRLRNGRFDELYVEFASKIARAENRTYAIAYATDLAGQSARDALPFFKDLAENGLEQSRVSAQQAEDASRLQKEYRKLSNEVANFGTTVGNSAVPWLKEMIGQMNEGIRIAGGFGAAIQTFGFMKPTDNPGQSVAGYRDEIAGLQADRARFVSSNADTSAIDMSIRTLGQRKQFAEYLQRQQALALGANIGRDEVARFGGGAGGFALPPPPAGSGGSGGNSTGANDGARLISGLEGQLAQLNGEASMFDKVMRQITDGTKKFTDAEIAAALALAGEYDERVRLRKEVDQGVAAYERDKKSREEAAAVVARFNKSLSTQAQGLQMEIDLMGATEAQREKAIALRALENQYNEAASGLRGKELEQLTKLRDVERERISGLLDQRGAAQARKKTSDDFIAEQKRQYEETERLIGDSIMRGFDRGSKSGWDIIKDTLINGFKTLVLRPLIQPIMQAGAGAITGMLGFSGNAAAAGTGGTGGAGGLMSMFSGSGGISGMAGMLTGGFDSLFQSAGVGMGSQWIADIGNYGLGMPVLGGALQMLTGNVKGGAGSMIGGAIGSLGGPIGTVIGSTLGSIVGGMLGGGGKGGPASFTGLDVSGTADMSGLTSSRWIANSQNSKRSFSWESFDHGATGGMNELLRGLYTDLGNVADQLGIDRSRLNSAQVGFGFRVTEAGTGAGPTTQEVINAFAQNLGQVSDQLANVLMPNLKEFAQANETATQTLVRMVQVQEQLRSAEAQAKAQLAGAVRGLPGALGITGLQGAVDALSVSEYQSPLSRLGAARGLLDSTYNKAMGGDLTAVNAFPQILQQALTIGRDVGASGPAFQDLFKDGNRQLNDLLAKQQSIQHEMLLNVDVSIREMAQDQIGEIRKQTAAMVAAVNEATAELRRIRQQA